MKDAIKLLYMTTVKNAKKLSSQRDPFAMLPNDLRDLVEDVAQETANDRKRENYRNRP
jgi:hypothetical protein